MDREKFIYLYWAFWSQFQNLITQNSVLNSLILFAALFPLPSQLELVGLKNLKKFQLSAANRFQIAT